MTPELPRRRPTPYSLQRILREASRNVKRLAGDLAGRGRGLLPRLRHILRSGPVDDERLAARVRSKAGHYLSRPRDLVLEVRDGIVTLRGPVPANEAGRLASRLRWLIGAKAVRNMSTGRRWKPNGSPRPHADIRRMPSGKRRWPLALRFAAVLAGAIAILAGYARRGAFGWFLSLAGAGLILRGLFDRRAAIPDGIPRDRVKDEGSALLVPVGDCQGVVGAG